MSFRNHDLSGGTVTILRLLWAIIWIGIGVSALAKTVKLLDSESGLGGGMITSLIFCFALFSVLIGLLPWFSRLSEWFGDWFVMSLLWTNEHETKAGDPLEPICRLIESGRHREARLGLEKLLERHPDNHEARFLLAEVLAVYQNEEDAALQMLREYFIPAGAPRKCKPIPENVPALLLYCDLAERFDLRDEAVRALRVHCRMKYHIDDRDQLQTRLEALLRTENQA